MRTFHKTASSVAVAALFSLFAATSNATVIGSGSNNPLLFGWSINTVDGLLTGNGSLAVSGFSGSSLTVAVTLNNTSADTADRLTAFGFGINPNAASVGFNDPEGNDGGMVGAELSAIPSLALIEVCAYGGPNCQGGANGGILGGGSDTFTLTLAALTGTTWGSSVDIAPIGFKYQTDGTSYEFTVPNGGTPPLQIPEPGALFLVGAGLLGLGMARRRKPA